MRELNVKRWLAALLIALLPCVAGAAGLGRLTVFSALGEPLNAEIELVSVTKEELSSLDARLAPVDEYRKANLQYNAALQGARISIERRANGQPYIKITSSRTVGEPFIDLLIELTWTSGRLTREYTALLDPPGIAPAPPASAIAKTPVARPQPEAVAPAPVASAPPAPKPVTPAPPAPKPIAAAPVAPAPVAPAPIAQAPVAVAPAPVAIEPVVSAPIAAAPKTPPVTPSRPITGANEYGPIKRGESLGWIALSVLPEGVTLQQMQVGLFRSNPEAFIRKNMNLVRAGKILRLPNNEELAAITQPEALKEYRTHVADWNAYRQQLADATGVAPADGRSAVSGKITTKVEDKAGAGEPKDVVRLSKGEPPGGEAVKGKPRSNAERIRMLEEEAVAREKALTDANERISQLEKTIKDMQKLLELKSPAMAAVQQQAQPAPKPVPEAAAPVEKPVAVRPQPAAPVPPKPKPKPKAATPPPPEPELIDRIMAAAQDPFYLATGGGVIALGGLAIWMVRRRRAQAEEDEPPRSAPTLSEAAAAAAGAAAETSDAAAAIAKPAAAAHADEVDPMAEAEVYIAYGRDGQAEEILKEALARDPAREDLQLKLLEIYCARQDQAAFGKLAGAFRKLTGGSGNTWTKVAAMGSALDPANKLYETGGSAAPAVPATAATTTTKVGADSDVDFDVGPIGPTVTTDITLDAGIAQAAVGVDTTVLDPGALRAMAEDTYSLPARKTSPDFTLEVPTAGDSAVPDIALDAAGQEKDVDSIDFHVELPTIDDHEKPTVAGAGASEAGIDFKLDGVNLSLDDKPKSEAAAGADKNGHWYDVQTKFDLAKAYQEMGDKDGAKEILQEVIKEGDTDQKAQAKKLLDHLG